MTVAIGAAAITSIGVVAVPAGASAVGSASAGTYYRAVSVCKAAKPGHASCFAMKRVKASAGALGARLVRPLAVTSGPAGGYTPADLATAYKVNAAAATTQTVAIVDAYDDPNALTDLNTFDAHYGLPAETATSFRKVNQTGGTTPPPADAGWAGEISLDLDAVRGLCHGCKILLVEANSNSFADLGTAENEAVTLGAKIISNSYGGPESGTPSPSQLAAYNHPGVVITVSTGDNGMFDWDNYNAGGSSSNAPEQPSSFNTVVAVGGTTLYLNDDATRAGETVWNENGASDVTGGNLFSAMGASGGGCSTVITGQLWQRSVANYAGTTCGTKRLAADVSALADPYTGYDIVDTYQTNGTWFTYGGTSLASPLVAAMWGLAGGAGGVKYPSLSLYGHFKSTTGAFYDVSNGGNGYCDGVAPAECGSGTSPNTFGAGILDCAWTATGALAAGRRECNAMTGYDGPSGVGTPNGVTAFKAMAPTVSIQVPTTITHGTAATFKGSAVDPFPGGTISSYKWTFGDGGTAAGATVSHTYASAGTYTVTLKATDNYGRVGSKSVSVTVH